MYKIKFKNLKTYNNIEELDSVGQLSPNSLVNADCLEAMEYIASNSVDLILADLPYGSTNCKWDSPISLDKLWVQYKRILKPNGAVVLFAQTPFDKVLGNSNLDWLKYEWIWEKPHATGFLNAKKMPMKAHENILVFYNKPPKYYPQKSTGHKPVNPNIKTVEVSNKTEVYGKVQHEYVIGGNTDRYPRSVLLFSSDKQTSKSSGFMHPTQKPIALIEYLIKTYTDEGDIILDNVMGSGTTPLGALKNNRKFIGIDKEKEYYIMTINRLDNYLKTNK